MEFASKIIEIKRETKDTVTVRIKAVNFNFKAGQFVNLFLKIGEKEIKRPYSISSSPSEKDYIEITSKRFGVFSTYLDELAEIGEEVKIQGPFGLFTYNNEEFNKAIFIAAGSGIAPIRGIIKTILGKNIELYYSVKTEEDVIYKNEIESWNKNKNFKSKIIFTRENGKRIDEGFLKENIKFDDKTLFYVCGPPAFVKDIVEILKKIGAKQERIKTERFG